MKRIFSQVFRLVLIVFCLSMLLTGCGTADTVTKKTNTQSTDVHHYTYADIVNRLYDLESLAVKPSIGENSDQFSSYDRRSAYNEKTDSYRGWGANGDGEGIIRMQADGGKVIAEMDGPGYITRIWSAEPKTGHIKIFIDGAEQPVIDLPFKSLFGSTGRFNYSQLSYIAASGKNLYVPITYNKSCKVVVYGDWGLYYLIDYTTLPKDYTVESFKMPLGKEQKDALSKAQNFLQTNLGSNPSTSTNEEKISKNIDIEPSRSSEIFKTDKAGAITGIKIKVNNLTKPFEDWEALRELTISAYWDGDSNPSVWAPLGDFFGSAAGLSYFKSLPLGMQEDGWLYCYWYMPFEKGASIEIKNDGNKIRNIDFEIITTPLKKPTDQLMRFHAKWTRNSDPLPGSDRWPDSSILNIRGQGRFLGFMLHVYKKNNDKDPGSGEGNYWWGEGDEKFFIDGEKFPSWYGTGTEDYFGYAWCDPALFSKPFHSQSYNKGGVLGEGNKVVNRFQIIDNIPFQKSFDGYLEKFYSEDYVNRATVTYWYLDSKGKDDYKAVSLQDRTSYYKYLPEVKAFYEGEDMYVKYVDSGIVEPQVMDAFGNKWNSNAQLWWRSGKKGDNLSLYINVEKKGKYRIASNLTTAGDYGIIQFYVNDNKLGDKIDAYSNGVSATGELIIGEAELEKGLNVIKVEIAGKNSKSTSFMFGLDYLKVETLEN